MNSETPLLHRLALALTNVGARVFRNQVGNGWYGKLLKFTPGGRVVIEDARPLRSGLCVGSSDLIGWQSIQVTPEMVGRRIAVFTAIEGKTGETRTTKEQLNFLAAVRDAGGIAIVVRDESEIERAVLQVKCWPLKLGD